MSLKDSFLRAWNNKFSNQLPPDLSCLDQITSDGGVDIKAVEKSLQKCNNTIAGLNKQLQETEFVASFLWDLIHGVNKVTPVPPHGSLPSLTSTRKFDSLICDLDNAIPLQGGFDSTGSTPTDDAYNGYVQSFKTFQSLEDPLSLSSSTETKKSLSSLQNDEDISPIGSINVDKRSNSVDLDSLETRSGRRQPSNHYYSVVSSLNEFDGNHRPHSSPQAFLKHMKPVPTPRSSINKFSVGSQSTEGTNKIPFKPQRIGLRPIGPPFSTKPRLVTDHSTENQPSQFLIKKKLSVAPPEDKIMRSNQSPPVPIKNKSFFLSWERKKAQRESDIVNVLPKDVEPEPVKSTVDVVNSESTESYEKVGTCASESSVKQNRRGHDYEEVIPVNKNAVEEAACVSTDDDEEEEDEPLYLNILLMQDRAKNRVQTFYSKGMNQHQQPNSSLRIKNTKEDNQSQQPQQLQQPQQPQQLQQLQQLQQSQSKIKSGSKGAKNPIRRSKPMNESVLSSESVRSGSSDSVFEDKLSWKNDRSLLRSAGSVDSQSDADDLCDIAVPVEEDGKLQMRKWVINSILDSENSFLCILDVLMKHMTTYKNISNTPQVVIPTSDIDTIFYKISEIHHAHKIFVYQLTPKIENWSPEQQIADIFKTLADAENKIAPEFIKNYPKAVQTVHKCWTESPQFAQLTKEIMIKNSNENPSLEELLHKPLLRFQRNSLVLHDLIKCTPPGHPDYDTLQKTLQLSRLFLENLESPVDGNKAEHQRYLAKQGLVVEKVGSLRKLRHLFLFNDVLVCARQKISSSKQKIHLEPKWYISVLDLSLDDIICIEEERQLAESQKQEIESLQKKMSELQKELKSELKSSVKESSDNQPRQWSFHSRSSKNLDKIRKKMVEHQAALIKASPCLMFRIHNRKLNRQHILLMASDYERTNWRYTIAGLMSRALFSLTFSTAELQAMLNSQKISTTKMFGGLISLGDLNIDEEHLFGSLNIKIFKLQGLKVLSDYYCTVEVDTFNQFFLKAKTKVVIDTMEPTWNEEFEIELEGSQTLRILCYKMWKDVGTLVGTCALELSKAWLRGDFQEKPISLNDELSLIISLMYCSRDQNIKRKQSSVKGGVFGAPIKSVAKREGMNVPLIVRTCIQEVETRGFEELGIYRISGVSGEIKKLRKIFEKNSKFAATMMSEFDINVVTGTLKTYFRELPESLFTDGLYPQLVKGMGLADPEAKEACISSLLDSLPDPNKSTAEFLMDHLIRVSMHEPENRMSLSNLATVFGPTLLRPAIKEAQQQTLEELFSSGTRDVMMQTNLLFYFFTLRSKNMPA